MEKKGCEKIHKYFLKVMLLGETGPFLSQQLSMLILPSPPGPEEATSQLLPASCRLTPGHVQKQGSRALGLEACRRGTLALGAGGGTGVYLFSACCLAFLLFIHSYSPFWKKKSNCSLSYSFQTLSKNRMLKGSWVFGHSGYSEFALLEMIDRAGAKMLRGGFYCTTSPGCSHCTGREICLGTTLDMFNSEIFEVM